jgi:hypothetical protein
MSSLSFSVGLSHTIERSSAAPFSFVEGIVGGDVGQSLTFSAGITAGWARLGSTFDLYNPLELHGELSEDVTLDLEGPVLSGSRLESLTYLNLPSPIRHHVVRLGVKAAFATGSESSRSESFAVPRGSFVPEAESRAGRSLFALDYLMPLVLLDQPLILGTYLLGFAAGVHLEVEARWGFDPAAFTLGDDLYLGVELTPLLGSWSYVPAFPFVMGVSFRVSMSDPGRFDAARDIGLYFSLGLDSFTTAGARLRQRALSAPPRG